METTNKSCAIKNGNAYLSFLESSPDPIVIYNSRGETKYVNIAFEKTFGWSRNELIGHRIDFVPKDHLNETLNAIKQLKNGRTIRLFETKRLTKCGELLDLQLSAATHTDDEGKQSGFIVILRNITELKKTRDALQESENRYRILVEESPYGISIIGSIGNYKYINPKFSEIFGYTLEDIPTGFEWFEKAYPDEKYRKKVISTWNRDQKKFLPGTKNIYKFNVVCKDKSTKTIMFRPVQLDNGDIILNYEDITQREKIEKKLQRSHLELAQAYEKLRYFGRLRDKAIEHLSHELKTPISLLLAVFRILKDHIKTNNNEKIIKIISRGERSVFRLMKIQKKTEEIYKLKETLNNKNFNKKEEYPNKNKITNAFLGFEQRKKVLYNDVEMSNLEKIQLDLLLRKVIEKSIKNCKYRDIEFVVDLENNIFLFFNKRICNQILMGILCNAIENTPDEGQIKIKLTSNENTIDLQFIDCGIGITKSNQECIFKGFATNQNYLNYTTKTPYEFSAGGIGLDLLRMRLYSRQYGFKLDFKSERCKFIPDENDLCPGTITNCNFISKREDCLFSGGTIFSLKFLK